MKSIKLKTKEGKDIKSKVIDMFEYKAEFYINNWGESPSQMANLLKRDSGILEIQNELNISMDKFDNQRDKYTDNTDSEEEFRGNLGWGLVLGTIVFIILNRIFNIFYFGFRGILLTWFSCVLASTFVLVPILGAILKFVLIAGIILIIVGAIVSKIGNKSKSVE